MEIPEKLEKYKVHILASLGLCIVVLSVVLFVAPRFVTIVAYFWPLLVSTALFLIAVVVFGRTTAVSAADKPGEGLLHYVAGDPHGHGHGHHGHDHHKLEASTSSNNNKSD